MKARASSPSHHKNHKWPERRAAAQSLERFAWGRPLQAGTPLPTYQAHCCPRHRSRLQGAFRFLPLPWSISRCDDPHPHPGHVQGQEHAAQHHRAKTSSLTKQGHVWSYRRPPPLSASYLLSAPCFRAIAPWTESNHARRWVSSRKHCLHPTRTRLAARATKLRLSRQSLARLHCPSAGS